MSKRREPSAARKEQSAVWIDGLVYERIREAAKKNFRSIGKEIEKRLTESFADESEGAKR